ncbi:MAG: CHASE2 domain-containing protein [Halioglobus sp.]
MKIPIELFYGRLLLAVLGGVVCAALYFFSGVRPLDRVIYDFFNEAAPIPRAADILIVGVDESSLAELGRWPWPRENHVQLLRELTKAQTRAVAIDMLFAEPYLDYPEVDELLADAMRAHGSVVLPVFIGRVAPGGPLMEIGPIPILADAAAALGHVHIEVDNDGVARGVYLAEGVGEPRWRHFAVALAGVTGIDFPSLPGVSDEAVLANPNPSAIIRSNANLVPFMGASGSVKQIPYVDVMKGRYDPQELRDKIVFVGATAAGHVDNITTSLGQIPGVEINANIFAGLREGELMRPASAQPVALFSLVGVALFLFVITRLAPGALLMTVIGTVFVLLLISFLTLRYLQLWISPAPILLTLLFAYPLWNWLRLATAMDFIQGQLAALTRENSEGFLPQRVQISSAANSPDPVDQILAQLDDAYREARHNHELVRGTLEQLTSGVILSELSGKILLINDEARQVLDGADSEILNEVLAGIELPNSQQLTELLATLAETGGQFDCEGTAVSSGRDLLLRGDVIGPTRPLVLIGLTDVSALKRSEKRRAEALNFLSHDLRAPLTSVLALIESARDATDVRTDPALLREIEKYIQANLSYAENFIQLAKLEQTGPVRVDECDAQSLLDNAVAQLYHFAKSRDIVLNYKVTDDELWLNCSRDLVERVLINLLDNAIKHSDDGAQIELGLSRDGDCALFTVRDYGPGIDPKDVKRIFEQFQQGTHARSGAGLGLRFVQAVTEAHRGTVQAVNNDSGGSSFLLRLPLA